METLLAGGILLAGFLLGLLGGGGGILLVPLLIFLGDLTPTQAASRSLTLLGLGAACGVVLYASRSQVDFRRGTGFAVSTFAAWFATRQVLLPLLPATEVRDNLVFALFLIVMAVSGTLMLRKQVATPSSLTKAPSTTRAGLGGLLAGAIMGLTGAGGGFVIVPSLVKGLGLPMKQAVGTSLWVILVTSLAALALRPTGEILPSLLQLSALTLGVIPGFFLSARVSSNRLKQAFGIFTWVVALASLALKIQRG